MIDEDLVDFSNRLRSFVHQSTQFTSLASESLSIIDSDVCIQRAKNETFFDTINLRKLRIQNLTACSESLDEFVKLLNTIHLDRLEISAGPRGQMDQYIDKLVYIRKLERYEWIKELKQVKNDQYCVRPRKNEADLKMVYKKCNDMIKNAESIMCQDFVTTIKFYCSNDMRANFFDFILNRFSMNEKSFEDEDELEADSEDLNYQPELFCLSDDDDEGNEESEEELFIPKETIKKLEVICSWFLEREEQYELYDEKGEHCDINRKLRFGEMRNEFLNSCMVTYFKANSVSAKSGGSKQLTPQQISINNLVKASNKENSSLHSETSSQNDVDSDSGSILSGDPTGKQSKPVEYIEMFAENLDFSLKLLKHDNLLIQRVYVNSEETRIELISKLTSMILDQIQKEFENFFTHSLDFTKPANNGNHVILAITRLLVKVQNLKEKTTCLQTEDLTSTSKLLQFSLKLNEVGSQIFSSYLDVVKLGYYESVDEDVGVPENSSIHVYCRKFCDMWKYMIHYETFLADSVRIVCDGYSILTKSPKQSNAIIGSILKLGRKKDRSDSMREDERGEDEGDDDVIDDDEALRNFQQRNRRGKEESKPDDDDDDEVAKTVEPINEDLSNKVIERVFLTKTKEAEAEEFHQSPKYYFAKYYIMLIEKFESFLDDEVSKMCKQESQLSHLLSSSQFSANFNNHIKSLRAHVFYINNLEHVKQLAVSWKLMQNMKRVNSNFESDLNDKIEAHIQKACLVFDYLSLKWAKLVNLDLGGASGMLHSQSSKEDHEYDELNEMKNLPTRGKPRQGSTSSNGSIVTSLFKKKDQDNMSMKGISSPSSVFSGKFAFGDQKKKRREELVSMLKEIIQVCLKISVEKRNLSQMLKSTVKESIEGVLHYFESTGELKTWIESFSLIHNEERGDDVSLSDKLVDKFFTGIL